jgi:hypothetical protein
LITYALQPVGNVLSDEQVTAALRDLANSGFVLVDHAEDALQILARLTEVTNQDFTVRFCNPHGAKIIAAGRRDPANITAPQHSTGGYPEFGPMLFPDFC